MKKIRRRRRKNILSLIPFALLLAWSSLLIFEYPPNGVLSVNSIGIPVMPLFIVLFSSSIFFLVSFLLGRIHGSIFFIFFLIYAILSAIRLNSLFFVILLLILLVVAELFVRKGDI